MGSVVAHRGHQEVPAGRTWRAEIVFWRPNEIGSSISSPFREAARRAAGIDKRNLQFNERSRHYKTLKLSHRRLPVLAQEVRMVFSLSPWR